MSTFESAGIVTLLTDFGLADTYVGQMKGVLLGIEPTLKIVDLTHDVSPQDIDEGAFQLAAAIGAFPSGTVHVAVVDPGVGTGRRAIVVQTSTALYVAPDNGLLSYILPEAISAFEISNPDLLRDSRTSTFHGRDVFAPTAGHLASGRIAVSDVGPSINPSSLIAQSRAIESSDHAIGGEIVSVDRFGNCITLIPGEALPPAGTPVEVRCREFRTKLLAKTYQGVAPGEPVSLVGSYGTLELSVRDGSAAAEFSLARGDRVVVRLAG